MTSEKTEALQNWNKYKTVIILNTNVNSDLDTGIVQGSTGSESNA